MSALSAAVPERMKTREAAEFLGLSYQTLVNWRAACKGPEFVRLGRTVRYERADLEAFIEQGKVRMSAPRP